MSYAGVRDIARAAGIIPAGLAVLSRAARRRARGRVRRGAGPPRCPLVARWLVWLSIIALAAQVGAADAAHAMTIDLPRRPAGAAVAVLPWVLLLLGFQLCLSVLRHPPEQAPIGSAGHELVA